MTASFQQQRSAICRSVGMKFALTSCLLLGMMMVAEGFFPIRAWSQDLKLQEEARILTPPPGKSLIYFHYNRISWSAETAVALDKAETAVTKNEFVVWEVQPGKHELMFSFYKKIGAPLRYATKITCEPDAICYYNLFGFTDTSQKSSGEQNYSFLESKESAAKKNIRKFRLAGWFQDGKPIYQKNVKVKEEKEERPDTPVITEKLPDERETAPTPAPEKTPVVAADAAKSQPEMPGSCYVLAVGIANYATLEPVATAVNDVQAVTATLREKFGCNIQTVLNENATRTAILDAFTVFQKLLKPEDKLIVYYSGRSALDQESQSAYWLPVDAQSDSMTQWIGADIVTASLKQIPAQQILILADSQYSGMLERARQADLSDPAKRRNYVEKMQNKRGRVVIMSGADAPAASASDSSRSIFASALMAALTEQEASLFTAEELFRAVQEFVAGQSAQVPVFGAIRNSGHDGGDFIFQAQ